MLNRRRTWQTTLFHRRLEGLLIARINILYPSSGDVLHFKLLLLPSSPRSFEQARTVDGTVYNTYHNAAQAHGLLHEDSEGQLCFNEARDGGYLPAQLRSLLVTLIVDGDEHGREILDSNIDILMADLAEQECIPTKMTWNACFRDISNRLETMGRTMTDLGLPEPADDSTEVARECMRTCP